MPELPDVTIYVEKLAERIVGHALERARIAGPFVVRSFDPPIETLEGRSVTGVRRIGKRIVIDFDDGLHLIVHLMIAGRLLWRSPSAALPKKLGLAAFDFTSGSLLLTEAGSKRRASIHVARGEAAVREHDRDGIEVLDVDVRTFRDALLRENRTLKRALTDPRLFSGIGNAYSDEILHAARVSPVRRTQDLADDEIDRLFDATQSTLAHWIDVLRAEFHGRFPDRGEITAFRDGFAVHGRFGQPCPDCRKPVQRIRYADNETNYCAACQTGGRVLADRSLSRLLKDDWPRSIDELDAP